MLKRMEASNVEVNGELAQISGVSDTVRVREDILQKLLDLLELASRRGAFEIDEFADVHEVYVYGKECLQTFRRPRR